MVVLSEGIQCSLFTWRVGPQYCCAVSSLWGICGSFVWQPLWWQYNIRTLLRRGKKKKCWCVEADWFIQRKSAKQTFYFQISCSQLVLQKHIHSQVNVFRTDELFSWWLWLYCQLRLPTPLCPLACLVFEYWEDANSGSQDAPSEQRLWTGCNQALQERSLTAPKKRYNLRTHVLCVFLSEVLKNNNNHD